MRFPAYLGASAFVALAACSCPPAGPPPPTFMVAFSADTLSSTGVGFRQAEVRSAYIVRYGSTDFQPLIDTLRQKNAPSAPATQPIFVVLHGKNYPTQFSLPEYVRQNVSARSYRLVVPAAGRTYDITNVVLEQANGSGRCASPYVSRREATINGQLRDGLKTPPELTK
ncbi:hypothetical protein [Hymenobacter daeguensis]